SENGSLESTGNVSCGYHRNGQCGNHVSRIWLGPERPRGSQDLPSCHAWHSRPRGARSRAVAGLPFGRPAEPAGAQNQSTGPRLSQLCQQCAPPRPETAHCRSLISHSRRAVSASCASGLGGLCSWSKKYPPLTFAMSGEVASHTRVSAPFSGLPDTGLSTVMAKPIRRPLLRLNSVATSPGWKQFAVTPVPSRRRAHSVVDRVLASLVSP